MRALFCLAAISIGANAYSETILPDSLLCESENTLATIATEPWAGKGGNESLRQAGLAAEFYRLGASMAGVKRDLATREESIRADSGRGLAAGSTSARASAATADGVAATNKSDAYALITRTCAGSGVEPLPVIVLERKSISGTARVRVAFRGTPADLWVFNSVLQPR